MEELKEITKTGDYAQQISALPEVPVEVIDSIKTPSKDEISILNMILSKCPQEFLDKERKEFKYESFEKMPIEDFHAFLSRAKEAKAALEVQ